MKSKLKKHILRVSSPALTFFLGILLAVTVTQAMAAIGDDGKIHACVKNSNGSLHIVEGNTPCGNGETAVEWQSQIIPVMCPGCSFDPDRLSNALRGKNLTNAILDATGMNDTDYTGTNFTNASLGGISGGNTDFSNVIFVGANLSRSFFVGAVFDGADFSGSDLTEAVLEEADLEGAIGMDTATLTGVSWFNTTCPDGTNSDNNGNTCEGHLTP